MQIFKRTLQPGSTPDLFEEWRDIGLGCEFTLECQGWLVVTGHVDAEHRAKSGTLDKAVMIAFQAQKSTFCDGVWSPGSWIEGSKTGCNIYDRTDHYGVCPIAFSHFFAAGTHKVTLFGRSASTAAVGVDGLAELKDGFSCVTYQVIPDAPAIAS